VALFVYDNNTFIVESYRDTETDVNVSLAGEFTKLRNLVTDEVITGQAQSRGIMRGRQGGGQRRMSFKVHLMPHSYAVFAAEKKD
jgi:hypothetical protein